MRPAWALTWRWEASRELVTASEANRRASDREAGVKEGRSWVVDIDLEKFFDRVNHDILMSRLAKRIADRRVLRLIRRYLNAGVLTNGVVIERHEGTPQGGPLSPLLANVLLDEVDKELERRGHAFVRYADDLNVYVRSQRAGERVMTSLRKLFGKLKLRVNETKSKVTRATNAGVLQTDGSSHACRLTSTHRTARCGPACRVVWHGTRRPNRRAPYADRLYGMRLRGLLVCRQRGSLQHLYGRLSDRIRKIAPIFNNALSPGLGSFCAGGRDRGGHFYEVGHGGCAGGELSYVWLGRGFCAGAIPSFHARRGQGI